METLEILASHSAFWDLRGILEDEDGFVYS